MNAGGKKAVLWGTALDNLASWRMVDCDGNWLEPSSGWTTTSGKIHDAPVATFETPEVPARRHDADLAPRRSSSKAGAFARKASARTSPTSSSAGLPGVQKEGCDGLDHVGALDPASHAAACAHRLPRVLRPGARGDPVDRRDQGLHGRRGAAGRAVLAGLEHLDERYLRAVGYATKSKRGAETFAFPKMALFGDIVGEDADDVARRGIRGRADGERPLGRRLRRGLGRSPQEVLARPLAHGGDRASHERVQDQRGRGHPAAADGRIHGPRSSESTSSCRSTTSSRCSTRSSGYFADELGAMRLGKTDDADVDHLSRAELFGTRVQQTAGADRRRARALALSARAHGRGPRRGPLRRFRCSGYHWTSSRLKDGTRSLQDATTDDKFTASPCAGSHSGTLIRPSAGPQPSACQLEVRELRADRLRATVRGRRASHGVLGRLPMPCTRAFLQRSRLRRAAHACRRWQRAHQHSCELRQLRDVEVREPRRGTHHEDRPRLRTA